MYILKDCHWRVAVFLAVSVLVFGLGNEPVELPTASAVPRPAASEGARINVDVVLRNPNATFDGLVQSSGGQRLLRRIRLLLADLSSASTHNVRIISISSSQYHLDLSEGDIVNGDNERRAASLGTQGRRNQADVSNSIRVGVVIQLTADDTLQTRITQVVTMLKQGEFDDRLNRDITLLGQTVEERMGFQAGMVAIDPDSVQVSATPTSGSKLLTLGAAATAVLAIGLGMFVIVTVWTTAVLRRRYDKSLTDIDIPVHRQVVDTPPPATAPSDACVVIDDPSNGVFDENPDGPTCTLSPTSTQTPLPCQVEDDVPVAPV